MQSTAKPSQARSSSIKLLRIISMVMIVACHFASHGGFSFDTSRITVPRLWWSFIEMGGNLGVDVFVLISGYFLVTDSGRLFNTTRILKFWGQVAAYSIGIYALLCIVGISELSVVQCIKALFPITLEAWWFASAYFVLYLLHPFLNMLLRNLERKTYQALLVMLLFIWCIIPTLTGAKYQSNSLLWFVTLYFVAGYMRLHSTKQRFTARRCFAAFAAFSALRYLSCVAIMILGCRVPQVAPYSLHFYNTQSVLTLLSAVYLFAAFEKLDLGSKQWINKIASATFGVYLIHDSNLVSPLLWRRLFENAKYQNSAFLIPYSLFAIAAVYVACTLIDLVRQYVLEKPFMTLLKRHSEKLQKPLDAAVSTVKRIVFGKDA